MADHVVVIGGGIVGGSAAYALARRGARVTLVDRGDIGQATAAGAGIIAAGTSLRALPAFFALGLPASQHYATLIAALAGDGETDTGYAEVGLLHVATSADEAARLDEVAALFSERRAAGFAHIGAVTRLSGTEARTAFPALGEVAGAVATGGAARVDGRLLRDALRRAGVRRGVRIVSGAAALASDGAGGCQVTVESVPLDPADAVILAGGAWSGATAAALGIDVPVAPQRGQILHLEMPDANTAHWPIVVGFHSHYLLTFAPHRVMAGATRESDSGFDPRATAGGVREALSEALRVASGLAAATLREVRVGLRPASPDGLPIIGRAPGQERVWLATGHGPSGLQLGPYTGELVAGLALGGPAPLDLTPFALERFHGRSA
ncbi:MAG TPA: FAD-dependent oxidoreductase [Ktedonobacterales bacterium]|nr:FAD-dependent oxidoreductase [Ktedonobacterales bacterium]